MFNVLTDHMALNLRRRQDAKGKGKRSRVRRSANKVIHDRSFSRNKRLFLIEVLKGGPGVTVSDQKLAARLLRHRSKKYSTHIKTE